MNPSRELDALIAEKIMGWKFCGKFTTDPNMQSDRWATDSDGQERYYSEVPNYSTEISAAWQVVEKIKDIQKAADYDLEDHSFTLERFPEGWTVGWFLYGAGTLDAVATTAPHAICLAALKVVGYEV